MLAERADRVKEKQDDNALSAKVMVMDPILRFLQLLCENHNAQLQVRKGGLLWLVTQWKPL